MSTLTSRTQAEASATDRPRVRRRWAERFPALYPLAVEVHRLRRRAVWLRQDLRGATVLARSRGAEDLPVRVLRHKSLLLRTLGDSEMRLQHNKVTNLRIAAAAVDGLLIRPGEEFSFCRTVGKATARKGYVEGMLLDNGRATAGVGGGICQLANLLHWMVLHSPLTVTERSEHSFDPFPDQGRVLPWGVGCAVYYNYVDLRFRNDTDVTFQLRTRVGERYLEGELRAAAPVPHSYSVYAVGEGFDRVDGRWYRHNEIWRDVIDRRTGDRVGRELLKRNRALVTYEPELDDDGRPHRGG
ncbi:vancomycin resistance protein VanW [Friedmanniella endophytica]|uniref:Vancomycin resistance protein VanW n=1 Tax=Microlunatus kandeliicorticis TaxID=1759536 RepID=A0A7W3P6E5_9ACTN|nr:VanW family protein [Microlunatus kandeliicorticis]MBA8794894.1 vancomycin resistance protein VanW [Microlunatus kandeliicorticis]